MTQSQEPTAPKMSRPDFSVYIFLGNGQCIGLASQNQGGPDHLLFWDDNHQTSFDLGTATKQRLQSISEYLRDLEIHVK